MKIAVATDGRAVSASLASSPIFTIAEVSSGSVRGMTRVNNPGYKGAVLVDFLSGRQVTALLVGNAEINVRQLFNQKGIKVIIGVGGNVEKAMKKYSAKVLKGVRSSGGTGVNYDLDRHRAIDGSDIGDDESEPDDTEKKNLR